MNLKLAFTIWFFIFCAPLALSAATPRNYCRLRGMLTKYDIEVEWHEAVSTKIKSLKLVYPLTSNVTPESIRSQNVPTAVATVKIPSGGIEMSDFVQERNKKRESDTGDLNNINSAFVKWTESTLLKTSYLAVSGIESPLEIINPPIEFPALRIELKKGRKLSEYVATPAQFATDLDSLDRKGVLAFMTNNLNSREIDDDVVKCILWVLSKRFKNKAAEELPACKCEPSSDKNVIALSDELLLIADSISKVFTK